MASNITYKVANVQFKSGWRKCFLNLNIDRTRFEEYIDEVCNTTNDEDLAVTDQGDEVGA